MSCEKALLSTAKHAYRNLFRWPDQCRIFERGYHTLKPLPLFWLTNLKRALARMAGDSCNGLGEKKSVRGRYTLTRDRSNCFRLDTIPRCARTARPSPSHYLLDPNSICRR